MGLIDAFRDLVLSPLQQDSETKQIVQQSPYDNVSDNYDKVIRNKLDRGQLQCDTDTQVLWYCYCYLYQHLDAYLKIISESRILIHGSGGRRRTPFWTDASSTDDDDDDWEPSPCRFSQPGSLLMVDVGCGPMTSCLALVEHHLEAHRQPISISYVGIDHSEAMLAKAKEFSTRADLFDPSSCFMFAPSWDRFDFNELAQLCSVPRTLILNFSYFFGQNTLDQSIIDSLAVFAQRVLNCCQSDETFLVYANINWGDGRGRYDAFKQALGIRPKGFSSLRYDCKIWRKFTDWETLYSRPLEYQIQRLN